MLTSEESKEVSMTKSKLAKSNKRLYTCIKKCEYNPAELAVVYGDIVRESDFCLAKKYDTSP